MPEGPQAAVLVWTGAEPCAASEICGNNVDDNCDGQIDEGCGDDDDDNDDAGDDDAGGDDDDDDDDDDEDDEDEGCCG